MIDWPLASVLIALIFMATILGLARLGRRPK